MSDADAFDAQIGYLLERSPFYRSKGIERVPLDEIATLPLTDKAEIRATISDEHPFGAHFAADPKDIVRIHSTSGTTGVPSYIPLTAHDLDNWITGSSRSYAASGLGPGMRVITTYNAGPFAAGAALASFDRIGACHIPMATGNTERVLMAIERLHPDAVVATPSYAEYLAETGDLRDSSVTKVLVAGEPGGGEPGFRAAPAGGLGREGHRSDGDRRHRRLAVGRV